MDGVVTRKAELRDLEDVVGLAVEFQLHHEASNPRVWRITEQGRRELRSEALRMLANPGARILVAESEGKVVAFASGEIQWRDTYTPKSIGQISRIFVKREHRRHGIATCLVKQLCDFFASGGVEEVTLNYIIGNREAEELWSRLGFEPVRISANQRLARLVETVGLDPLTRSTNPKSNL